MGFLSISIQNTEAVLHGFDAQLQGVRQAIPSALKNVEKEMIDTLKKHIQEDWYYGYTPRQYIRRTDHKSLGTPIGSDDSIGTAVGYDELVFLYSPSGEHENAEWYQRDGDDLIKWIQQSHDNVPARPYWNRTVQELENGGIMQAFISGMAEEGQIVVPEGGQADLTSLKEYEIAAEIR